jgi:nucleoside-diphosphate-sugar epimerase
MKKVLVTESQGFIGRHCLPLLLVKGYEVHAVDLKVGKARHRDVKWHKIDLLASAQVSIPMAQVQPTHQLHLA